MKRTSLTRRTAQPARQRNFRPQLELLEDRSLLAITITPGGNVNVSQLNDNQAEPTIALDPTNPTHLFSASVTAHGSYSGVFDPNVNVPGVFQDHTFGIFAAYSANSGTGWSGRVMATGGPTEGGADKTQRSLPSAYADPQAAFDDYGNLYLTYLSSVHQFGTATGGDATSLTDTGRQWIPNMWAGRVLTIRPKGQAGIAEESAIITGNTATQLTVAQVWATSPGPNTAYEIRSGSFGPTGFTDGNAAVALLSTDGGQSFQFLRFLDTGVSPAVDYPAVATGPGRNANEKSVWFAWRGGNNLIDAAGAPVTGKGAANIGTWVNEQVTGSSGMIFPRVQVGPSGQVLVSFHSLVALDEFPPTTIYVNADPDGLGPLGFRGAATTVAQTNVVAGASPPFTTIPAQPNRGITPQVNLAWDRSGTYVAAPNGRVYLVFTLLTGTADTDVYVTSSDDSGATWGNLKQVNSNNPNSQFLPSIAVDQTNGDVAVVWLDAREDPGNLSVKLYGTVSGNGGASYLLPEVPIASGSSRVGRASDPQRGFSTGNNTPTTLNDLNQNWVPNNYWRNNFSVLRNDGEVIAPYPITASTATQLTVANWGTDPVPPNGVGYTIISSPPQGSGTVYNFDYGEYTGVAFYNGVFYPIWPDNSNSTANNPNGQTYLDLYTASVLVTHTGGSRPRLKAVSDGAVPPAGPIVLGFASAPQTELVPALQSLGARTMIFDLPPTTFSSPFPRTGARAEKLAELAAADPLYPGAKPLSEQTFREPSDAPAVDNFFAAWAGVFDEVNWLSLLG